MLVEAPEAPCLGLGRPRARQPLLLWPLSPRPRARQPLLLWPLSPRLRARQPLLLWPLSPRPRAHQSLLMNKYRRSRCALRVSGQAGCFWARDASPTPSGLQRAHRGPGGYCRRSGNQGTTSRPTRAHDTLQKISLRTRLSKPGEALQAWRGSSSLARFLPDEASSVSAVERTWALHPPQSHGRASAW